MSKVSSVVVGGALVLGVAVFLFVREEKSASTATREMAPSATAHVPGASTPPGFAEVEIRPPLPASTVAEGEQPGAHVPTTPMPIRPEFEAVFRENPLLAYSHAAMEKEPRDEAWATAMEDNYGRAFAANVDLNRYGIPSAECRSTRCEIQMSAYGAPQLEPKQWGDLLGRGLTDVPPAEVGNFIGGTPADFTFGSKVVDGTTVLVFHVSFVRDATQRR